MKSYHYTSCLNDDLAGMDGHLSSKKAKELTLVFGNSKIAFPVYVIDLGAIPPDMLCKEPVSAKRKKINHKISR